jgi:hypothetical protein
MVAHGRPDFYGDATFKLVPRWDDCMDVVVDCVGKYTYFSDRNEVHLTLQ